MFWQLPKHVLRSYTNSDEHTRPHADVQTPYVYTWKQSTLKNRTLAVPEMWFMLLQHRECGPLTHCVYIVHKRNKVKLRKGCVNLGFRQAVGLASTCFMRHMTFDDDLLKTSGLQMKPNSLTQTNKQTHKHTHTHAHKHTHNFCAPTASSVRHPLNTCLRAGLGGIRETLTICL